MWTVAAASQEPERDKTTALHELVADVAPNVNRGLFQDIAELRYQDIEVDNENEPASENTQSSAPATQTIGQWVTPTISLGGQIWTAVTPKAYGGYRAGKVF